MLASWKKSYGKSRQCAKKQRYHFANKCLDSQSYGFSSSYVTRELHHKAEELTLLLVVGSLVVLIPKLKFQHFGHLMQRADLKRPWSWEGLKAEGKGGYGGWGGWMASLTQWTWVWVNSRRWWRTGKPSMLQSMGSQSWTQLSDWTKTTTIIIELW